MSVGDALGLPVEGVPRSILKKNPVKEMIGYGTYNQPPGTWSDDSSLTFCLAESLCDGFNLDGIAKKFVKWLNEGYWTPFGKAFDVGQTTMIAISRLKEGVSPLEAGPADEFSNGNGSLMRILPLAFYTEKMSLAEQFELTHQVSSITHRHLRSQMACGLYVQMGINLLRGQSPEKAYEEMKNTVLEYYSRLPYKHELPNFARILESDISKLSEDSIKSGGYVVDTLEASIWAFLNNHSYKETVLAAVNLGGDTDTTGAVAGGLAGLYYGYESIPEKWIDGLARKDDIIKLAEKFFRKLFSN